jgi:hypothetical protein
MAQQVKHDEWVGAADDGGDATHDRKRRRVDRDDHRPSLCPVTTIAGRCFGCVPAPDSPSVRLRVACGVCTGCER